MPAHHSVQCNSAQPDIDGQAGPPTRVNTVSNQDFLFERMTKCGLEFFVAYASWNKSFGSLQEWSCSPKLHVSIGEGSGQHTTPFSISSKHFTSICTGYGFSEPFLRKIVAKAPMFEYRFDYGSTSPSYLEIAMSTFENDSFFCLLRYDLKERSLKVLIFLKGMDHLRTRPLRPEDLLAWLESNRTILQRHPLMVLNTILEFIQHEAHQHVRWRLELYSLESRLGVTRDGDSLRLGGYAEVDHDFALLNADLAGLAKKLADTELSASTIHEHAKALQRLIGICEEYQETIKDQDNPLAKLFFSEQKEEIQATILRSELYLRNMKMAHSVLQSLSAVLYNRISKQDTDSMKTIAVVTLVFLPATFVSAIFSTGIFNFHAGESSDDPKTVSRYGWVYLLLCILSTTLTLVSWVCWYRWGRVWLEKLKFSRIHSERKRPRIGVKTEQDSNNPLGGTPPKQSGNHDSQISPDITPAVLRSARTRFNGSTGWNVFDKSVSRHVSRHGSLAEEVERGEAGETSHSIPDRQPPRHESRAQARFFGTVDANSASGDAIIINGSIQHF